MVEDDVGPGLAKKEMVKGHDGKSATDQDGVDPSDHVDGRRIFFMVDPQGLKGALESVDEVDGKCEYADQIRRHDPDLLESDIDAAVDVLNGFIVTRI